MSSELALIIFIMNVSMFLLVQYLQEKKMNRIKYKKYRLLQISTYDNLMKKDKIWNTLNVREKWKSIFNINRKLQKINFNKNGETIGEKNV